MRKTAKILILQERRVNETVAFLSKIDIIIADPVILLGSVGT